MLVATFLVVASSAPAQIRDDSGVRAFFEPVDVPLVNVDVHVTDADGRLVGDLTVADFEVLEDGRPVVITHFAAPTRVMGEDPTQSTRPQSNVLTEQGLNLVVFLDESDVSAGQRWTTINQLRDFLTAELPATLRLMLVTFREGRVTVPVPFTDDPSRLVVALDEIARNPRSRLDSERDRLLREMRQTAGPLTSAGTSYSLSADSSFDASTGERRSSASETAEERMIKRLTSEARQYLPAIRSYAAQQRQRTQRLLGELEMLVRSLSVIDGQKAVLLVCGQLEARPGEGLLLAWERAFPEMARQMLLTAREESTKNDVSSTIERLTDSANSNRVSFCTLSDPVRDAHAGTAETHGITGGSGVIQSMPDRDALPAISRPTGGVSLRSSSGSADKLGRLVQEMGSRYSLGFSPDHPADGQHHALTVRVRREGLDVRHREGYVHSPPADRIADRTLAAAMLGVTDNPLGVSIETQEVGPPQTDGEYSVSVLVKVPIAPLLLRPEGDRQSGQMTALVIVRGPDGLSDPQGWRYPIEVMNDQLMEALDSRAGLVLHLVLGKGPHVVAVGVRDDVGGTESTVTLEIDLEQTPSGDARAD